MRSPTFFSFIIRKDSNKDQTKSLPLKGHVNRDSSLICERQNEEKLNKPFGGDFMILQAFKFGRTNFFFLAFSTSGLFCAKGISMHLLHNIFQYFYFKST